MNKNKGFTLIELLVVIAIIGILASVVLASLSSARDKGKDAAVKSQLASMKAQAELFFANAETYDGVCAGTQPNNGFGDTGGPGLLSAAHLSSGTAAGTPEIDNAAGLATDAFISRCNDNIDGWAVAVPLSTSATGSPKLYCSDNTGLSKEVSANLASGAVVCPN
jgi:prepilin-type N-terminal cleavage/methylation domain-containing protein